MAVSDEEAHATYIQFKLAWERYECAPEDLNEAQQNEINMLISRQLMIEKAILLAPESEGVVAGPAAVQESINGIVRSFESRQAFREALERSSLNETLLQSALERELRIEAVLDRVCADECSVSEEEVELFYYMHPERFHVDERREAYHILITLNDDFPENTEERVQERIAEIRKRLLKNPKRFGEQAEKHSECPTAMHGGLIGRVERGKLFPELDEVLFRLEAGELSEPVRSSMGYHLILCTDIEPPRDVNYAEIRHKLKESLEMRQRKQFERRWIAAQIERLSKPAKVVNA